MKSNITTTQHTAGPLSGVCWVLGGCLVTALMPAVSSQPPHPVLALHPPAGAEVWTGTEHDAWNNGKEVPRWGVAEIQKMSPSTTGRCSRQTADQWERGTATRQPITQICSPGVVKLVYLQSRLGRTCEI